MRELPWSITRGSHEQSRGASSRGTSGISSGRNSTRRRKGNFRYPFHPTVVCWPCLAVRRMPSGSESQNKSQGARLRTLPAAAVSFPQRSPLMRVGEFRPVSFFGKPLEKGRESWIHPCVEPWIVGMPRISYPDNVG